jgi:hypothetical protein
MGLALGLIVTVPWLESQASIYIGVEKSGFVKLAVQFFEASRVIGQELQTVSRRMDRH